MRIRRISAEQAHAVPARAYDPRNPFEIRWNPKITYESEDVDDGGQRIPEGSTAQNNFQPVRWFRCNECGGIVRETHLDSHVCEA